MVTTFLPLPDITESCEALDTPRLGKQRSEIKIMLSAITGVRFKLVANEFELALPEKRGYQNHSATRMWRDHPMALAAFGIINCEVWMARFGHDLDMGTGWETLADMHAWWNWCVEQNGSPELPSWFGRDDVHASHRQVLLSKDFDFYKQYGWSEEPRYEYVWPVD